VAIFAGGRFSIKEKRSDVTMTQDQIDEAPATMLLKGIEVRARSICVSLGISKEAGGRCRRAASQCRAIGIHQNMIAMCYPARICCLGACTLALFSVLSACDPFVLDSSDPEEVVPDGPDTPAPVEAPAPPPAEPEIVDTLDYELRLSPSDSTQEYRLAVTGTFSEEEIQKIEDLAFAVDEAREIVETEKKMHIEALSPTQARVAVGTWPGYYVTLTKLAGIWSVAGHGQTAE
jgi:hypothetical protein